MTFHSRRFNRAADTYARHASVQASMAKTLAGMGMSQMPGEAIDPRIRFLEMGCGTGLLTAELRRLFPAAEAAITDLAPAMLESSRAAWESIPAEKPAEPTPLFALLDAAGSVSAPASVVRLSPFQLAASNALVQWFPDLAGHFRFVRALLAQGGQYWVSGFAHDNFPELNALLREPPFAYRDFPGHASEAVRAAAQAAGFSVAAWETETLAAGYPSPEAFLGAIRGLGSARRPEKPMTRGNLETLVLRYQERYPGDSREGGVVATWKPWYAVLRKA